MTGVNDSTEKTPNNSIDRTEKASDELVIVFSVCPAWMAKKDGGATPINKQNKNLNLLIIWCSVSVYLPKNVPKANGYSGTPMTGATKLINQLGKNGVIRKNRI